MRGEDRPARAEQYPHGATGEGQDHRLDQELGEDVALPRPDRHPDPDLPRPLRHRHEHDVHDPDAADQQGDGGDPAQQEAHDPGGGLGQGQHLREVPHREVVGSLRSDPVALAQQLGHLLLGLLDAVPVDRLHQDDAHRPHVRAPGQLLLHRRDREEHRVVLVLALRRLPLPVEDADDREGGPLDPHDLPHRVLGAEQVVGHRLPEQADLRGGLGLLRGEVPPGHDDPLAHLQELGGASLEDRAPVLVPVYHGPAGPHGGGGCPDRGELPPDGARVRHRQRGRAAESRPQPSRRGAPRNHEEQVRPHGGDLGGDPLVRSRADRHHDDDRRHADDHPQHREDGAHLVRAQRAEGDLSRGQEVHPAVSRGAGGR